MTVRVSFWNADLGRMDSTLAVLDHYDHVAECWYFKQPCAVVWADADNIELEG